MASRLSCPYAFNQTRRAFLANRLAIADTHWTRLKGLLGTSPDRFNFGMGLWIVPSYGVHTWAMHFAIDVVYLDPGNRVVHLEENVKPWRITPMRMDAASVLELPAHTIWDTGTQVGDQVEIASGESTTDQQAAKEEASGSGVGGRCVPYRDMSAIAFCN